MRKLFPAATLAALLFLPAVAEAHGLAQRPPLPIPQWLFAWAAAAVLVISFFALAVLWPTPRLEQDNWRPLVRGWVSLPLEVLWGAIGVFLLVGHDHRRLRRFGLGAGQLGADLRDDHVLGRARVRLDPVR